MSTALQDFGTWHVEKCSTKDCWCRMIITDTNTNLDEIDSPRLSTEGSDDMEFCIIPAGALHAKYANLVTASPKMLYALERVNAYLTLSSSINPRIVDELRETISPVITEARRKV